MKRTAIELTTGTVFTGGALVTQAGQKNGYFSLTDPIEFFGLAMSGADWLTMVSFTIGFFSFLLVAINQIRKMKK